MTAPPLRQRASFSQALFAPREDTRIHQAAPQWRAECGYEHRTVSGRKLRRGVDVCQHLVTLARRQVMVGMPGEIDQQPVADAVARVPRMPRADPLVAT